MPRARVLVLRDKQAEVMALIQDFYDEIMDAEHAKEDEDYDWNVIDGMTAKLSVMFSIEIAEDEMREHMGSVEALSGLIAMKVLDRNPPDTVPAWLSPWMREAPDEWLEP